MNDDNTLSFFRFVNVLMNRIRESCMEEFAEIQSAFQYAIFSYLFGFCFYPNKNDSPLFRVASVTTYASNLFNRKSNVPPCLQTLAVKHVFHGVRYGGPSPRSYEQHLLPLLSNEKLQFLIADLQEMVNADPNITPEQTRMLNALLVNSRLTMRERAAVYIYVLFVYYVIYAENRANPTRVKEVKNRLDEISDVDWKAYLLLHDLGSDIMDPDDESDENDNTDGDNSDNNRPECPNGR